MQNLLDPAILFFVFGLVAGAIRSNLELPPAISRFLSLYLLMSLGLKGGFALSHSGFTASVIAGLGVAVTLAICVPLIDYWLLKRVVSRFDAAAVAATYGSVSAVTFVTAVQYLELNHIEFGGYMSAAMALMESPAIIIAVLLANTVRGGTEASTAMPQRTRISKILHESFTDGAQLLLLGAMVIGLVTGDAGKAVMQPFAGDLFKGMLAFFLLDMGLTAARSFPEVKGKSLWLVGYAVVGPIAHAALALGLSMILHLGHGDGALLMILAASASYIAVPAVLRYAIPEAAPSLYVGLSLGVTFPVNILIGIPVYTAIARHLLQ